MILEKPAAVSGGITAKSIISTGNAACTGGEELKIGHYQFSLLPTTPEDTIFTVNRTIYCRFIHGRSS